MTEVRSIDPNTENLDDFNELLNGNAIPLEESEPEHAPEDSDEADETPDETPDDEDTPLAEDSEDENEEAEEPDPEPKPKSRFQERINELTQKAREADVRAKELEKRLNDAIAKLEKPAEPVKAVADKLDADAPTPDDLKEDGSEKYPLGEFDPLYIRDLTRHTIAKETEAANARQEEARKAREIEESQAALATEWAGKLETAVERYPDMLEKNQVLADTFTDLEPAYGEYLASTIMSMEHGPDVLYYLANNVAEAKRIASSGPLKATLALGRIEASFMTPTSETVKKPKVSKAPVPPVVNKGNAPRVNVPDDTDDLDAFSEKFFAKR